jgi:hypothetical protein
MALSAFGDRAHEPAEQDLARTLGPAYAAWQQLLASVGRATPAPAPTLAWGFTSASTGWSLRLKHKERVLAYLTPGADMFLFSLSLGEKAVRAAQQAALPAPVLAAIEAAPRYAEGRGCRFEVRDAGLAEALAQLVAIKRAN